MLRTEKLSCNRRLQENMKSRQNLFFVAPSVLPPPFPPQSSIFLVEKKRSLCWVYFADRPWTDCILKYLFVEYKIKASPETLV